MNTRRTTNYSYRTRSNNNEETTCNRLAARALYDTEEVSECNIYFYLMSFQNKYFRKSL